MRVLGLAGLAAVASALAAAFVLDREPAVETPPLAVKSAAPMLSCEFYTVVGRTPKVGFTFAMGEGGPAPVYTLADQWEMDGTRTAFEPPRPVWAFDGSDSPATLTSPDGAIRITLYAYDPKRSGTGWIEAGLRSVRYLDLDGRCRRGAA